MRRVSEQNHGITAVRHVELASAIGQGSARTLANLGAKWIGDPRTPDLFARLIELGPDNVEQMLNRLQETRSLIYAALRLKGTLLDTGDTGKIRIPRDACGWFLPHPPNFGLRDYLLAFRQLGIFCDDDNPFSDNQNRIELREVDKERMPSVGPKRRLRFIRAEERASVRYSVTPVSLIEVLDYLLDLCLVARIKGWQRTDHWDENFLPCAGTDFSDIYTVSTFEIHHPFWFRQDYKGPRLKFVLCLRTGKSFPGRCHCFYFDVVSEDKPAGVIAYDD